MSEVLGVLVALSPDAERVRATLSGAGYSDAEFRELDPATAVSLRAERPARVVVVPVGAEPNQSMELIAAVTHEALLPVVALLSRFEPESLEAAVAAGAWGVVAGYDSGALRVTLRVAWQRAAEYHALAGAFARRATIERAKGLLMARYGVDEKEAFALLRQHSQRNNRKLVDVAAALVNAGALLAGPHAGQGERRPLNANEDVGARDIPSR